MSQFLTPLRVRRLSVTVPGMPRLSVEVRSRLREELAKRKLSARAAAKHLGWHPSRVYHLLDGTVEMCVDDLEAFAIILQMRPTELVRDRGLEFAAEMTPTEYRFYERIRELTPQQIDAAMTLLAVAAPTARRALPAKTSKGRRA